MKENKATARQSILEDFDYEVPGAYFKIESENGEAINVLSVTRDKLVAGGDTDQSIFSSPNEQARQ